MVTIKKKLRVICLDGLVNYESALKKQEELMQKRMKDEIPDTLLLLEHKSTYTIGLNAKEKTFRVPLEELKQIAEVYEIGRGGKVTYHGPGQIVGYLIAKIPQERISLFIDNIEDVTIKTLKDLGINAYSRKKENDEDNKPIRGAWVKFNGKEKKLAAQGLEFKTDKDYKYSMHGFAININTNLSYFDKIYPCGFNEQVMGSAEIILGKKIDLNEVKSYIEKNVRDIFDYNILLKTKQLFNHQHVRVL